MELIEFNFNAAMIELIVGGARSGKSSYALRSALGCMGHHHFIATATASDDEMMERINRHQRERGSEWNVFEEPLQLANLVTQFSSKDIVLVDCLTLYLSNWLCSDSPKKWQEEKLQLLENLENSKATWFLVSNETGMGVIPKEKLSRDFIDESGWLHQDLAKIVDVVTLVQFGIPVNLKQ